MANKLDEMTFACTAYKDSRRREDSGGRGAPGCAAGLRGRGAARGEDGPFAHAHHSNMCECLVVVEGGWGWGGLSAVSSKLLVSLRTVR